MIKVNLLNDHTVPRRKSSFAKPTVSPTGLLLLAIFLAAIGGMGGWTWHVERQIAEGRTRRDELRAREARLQQLRQEIARFEKFKRARQNRINIIEELKSKQTGPVLLLNTVVQSIPKDRVLWLTALTQREDRVKIVGFTRSMEAIPDFMSNLAASGIFQSVDLEMVETEKEKESSKFSLVCLTPKQSTVEE